MSTVDKIKFTAAFNFAPDGSKENATFETSTAVPNGEPTQINNRRTTMGARWGTLEDGRVRCDGQSEWYKADGRQIGAFLEPVCGSDKVFAEPPSVTYIFDIAYDIIGFTINFDDKAGEYAEQIRLTYYDDLDNIIETQTFDNDSVKAELFFDGVAVKKTLIEILQWSAPLRYAKIAQVSPGIIFSFDGRNLYNAEFEESLEPFGVVAYPEVRFTFDNSDGEFDITNPEGYKNFLRTKMQLSFEFTDDGAPVFFGQYRLSDWQRRSAEDSEYFAAKPGIAIGTPTYPNFAESGTWSASEAAAVIFEGYTVRFEPETLGAVQVNKYIGEDVPIIDAIAGLGTAIGAYMVFEQDGSYTYRAIPTAKGDVDIDINYSVAFEVADMTQTDFVTAVECGYYERLVSSGRVEFKYTERFVGDRTVGVTKRVTSSFIGTAEQADYIGGLALAYYQQRITASSRLKGDARVRLMQVADIEHRFGKTAFFVTGNKIAWGAGSITETTIEGVGG